ncbi:aprataxin and PNK-like factor isoform X1 [Astyanax mexicanus]|uniref:aprataxin and PNK-like factor isoform X1 n=1 Tax=Astyanax mexicanus TaxID=7994 RepID=UPI0020CABCFB|nr:aprataxin and PNK-like factor isoform X1 [Astyanax mexicanus]
MPGFELEPVEGGQPIDLPYGETVIGRGPFLGVSDKRVSRNHGVLENVDGQLRLKPIHLNPCFVQDSLETPAEPLQKDQWHVLQEGSLFSLLPGKYVYRVRVLTEESTLSNSEGFEEEEGSADRVEKSKPPPESGETLEYVPQVRSSSESQTPELSTLSTQVEEKEVEPHRPDPAPSRQVVSDVPGCSAAGDSAPPTPQKTRVLPAWMTAAVPAAQSPSTAKAATKQTPARAAPKTTQSKRTPAPKRARNQQRSSADEEEEELSDVEQKPKKRARKLNSDTEGSQQEQVNASKPRRKKSVEDRLSEDSEREEEERKIAEDTPVSRAGGSASQAEDSGSSKSEKQQTQDEQQELKNSSSKPEGPRRTPCPYGASCYRKNPIHFQECSHPGDNDYEDEQTNGNEDDDEDDDRPECPYGTDCYRKNPLHKKEYKHTKPPAKASVSDDEEDEDEDRYEDSFINDGSEEEEEVDEDSDYVPESEDSGKEDVKRLQKEAKAFLRRKK